MSTAPARRPSARPPDPDPAAVRVPPLETGDVLTRAEFERRYEAMPEVKKAELIEGVVYMGSPVRYAAHGLPHSYVTAWLVTYHAATPGTGVGDNASTRLDLDNEPQPDACLFLDPACGGQARISDDDYIEGAPELVVEVASSSVSYDLHAKKKVYRRCGVREYVVWRVLDRQIDWFVHEEGDFHPLAPDEHGILRSRVFPGLWLDTAAMLRQDAAAALATLRDGLGSSEHAAFVKRLKEGSTTAAASPPASVAP